MPTAFVSKNGDAIGAEFLGAPVQLADKKQTYFQYMGHLRRLAANSKRSQLDMRTPLCFPQTSNRNVSNPHSKPKPSRKNARRSHGPSPVPLNRPAWDECTVLGVPDRPAPRTDARGRETSRPLSAQSRPRTPQHDLLQNDSLNTIGDDYYRSEPHWEYELQPQDAAIFEAFVGLLVRTGDEEVAARLAEAAFQSAMDEGRIPEHR